MGKRPPHKIRESYRRPHPSQPNRSTASAFGDDDTLAFLNNEWVFCTLSSNVYAARYDEASEALYLRFDDGSTYAYGGVSFSVAEAFAAAPSKGGFRVDVLSNYVYTKID